MTALPAASKATPAGSENDAKVPRPSADPAVPVPASVVTFQKHGGCDARPVIEHAVAGTHGAWPAAPPAQ